MPGPGDIGSRRETLRRCEVHGDDVPLTARSVRWTPISYRGGPLIWACPDCCRALGVRDSLPAASDDRAADPD